MTEKSNKTGSTKTDRQTKRPKRGEPITLAPLTPEEALRGLLATPPPPKEEKPKKKSKKSDKSAE